MRKNLIATAAVASIAALSIAACGTEANDTETVAQSETQTEAPAETPTPTPEPPKDTDEDGVPDEDDFRPKNSDVQTRDDVDTDGDGAPNYLDDFPKNAKYQSDKDGDRVADEVDDYPNDPDRSKALTRTDFSPVGDREWALIVKDPDAHIGKQVIVYADVFQFDAATGTDQFLAYADDAQWYEGYEFDDNTYFYGTDNKFKNVIEDDLVKVWGTIYGSFSYDTQAGGNTTVPVVDVEFIEVYGQS